MTSSRRARTAVVALGAVLALAGCTGDDGAATGAPSAIASPSSSTTPTAEPAPEPVDVSAELAALEAELGVRIGVHALDTATGRTAEYRADERFAYASTFKALAAGAVLAAADDAALAEVVPYGPGDLVTYSPVTEAHAGVGLPLSEVLRAAVQESDNTAANLLLARLGGPAGFAEALRALGDDVTQPVRIEPDLNAWSPGDPKDTSTPRALATDLHAYVLGDALDDADRALLVGWMRASTTGTALVRAGVPEGWTVADKSGQGSHGTRNDLAVVWPPGGEPIVLAVLTSRDAPDAEPVDAAVARATAVVVAALG
ncbi:class A beta-lactamase [Actinotalea fermentans]|uniref:Beta-lactamase n=1 Tax=Actinotalea fermentans TaxID=43671 RepID=A0A511Z0R8_9CELL|nr:class A beta-lactamase [Actinotalea fermentans]KGM15376.1 beta-lactamase [Actinotalea fermentans ATCC 43279 = JCM 9966 = DSM 3133]GEN81050.1 hypothetical protein AFE02nite_27840 [Actinotalea fermentans]